MCKKQKKISISMVLRYTYTNIYKIQTIEATAAYTPPFANKTECST